MLKWIYLFLIASSYAWGDNSTHQLSVDSVRESSIPVKLSQSLEETMTYDTLYASSLNEYLDSNITWYTDDVFTVLFDENNMPGEDLILYGKSE